MTSDLNLDWLISVDDHILEPPDLWVDRVATKDRDRAPHMETIDGMDYWMYDGKRFPSSGLSAVAGKSKEEFSPELGETAYKTFLFGGTIHQGYPDAAKNRAFLDAQLAALRKVMDERFPDLGFR